MRKTSLPNRLFLLAILLIAGLLSVTNGYSQYCTTGLYSSGCASFSDQITSFSTSGGSSNINNTNSGCSAGSYEHFSMTHSTIQGTVVDFSITNGPGGSGGFKIWVDYDDNQVFDDATELMWTSTGTVPANGTVTGSFTVPSSVSAGLKRMRLRQVFGTTSFTSCSQQTWGEVEDYNLEVIAAVACSGTPTGGSATSTITSLCNSTTPFTLNVTGSTNASGLTYQWEFSLDNVTWSPIPGATNSTLTVNSSGTNTYYRRKITCGANSAWSSSVLITVNGASYTTLPFNESFENTWVDRCDTRDVPNNFWRNTPATGNNSWRREDDQAAAAWVNPNLGTYTPSASAGVHSARFHSYQASSGTKGRFDLYVNANTANITKKLTFDFINTSGNDSLVVFVSTDGGSTFTRVDSVRNATAWRTKSMLFNSTSATTVIRFEATSDFGVTDIGLDNVNVADYPNCSGTPTGGTAAASVTNVCTPSTPVTFTVTGDTDAGALSYQWQSSPDNIVWTNIAGATGATYTGSGITANTYFRRQITCTVNTSSSTSVLVTVPAVSYTTLPFTESFESAWIDKCATADVPNNFWRNNPASGNNSWRRNDDLTSAGWGNPTLGAYTPTSSAGNFSARFHSYQASNGTKGLFDLYVNANTADPVKRLKFDFINTTGNDNLVVRLSTDGGVTFVRLDSVRNAADWRTKSIVFTSTSATTVIRFDATSDFGFTDIGLDNISLVNFPACTGTPTAGTTVSTSNNVCPGTPFGLTVTGATDASGLTYQWQISTNGGASWTNIAGATAEAYNSAGITVSTSFRRQIICGPNSSFSAQVDVAVNQPDYAVLPFSESFENTWMNGCDIRDIPNNYWRNSPLTGNQSWRREDDAAGGNWTLPANGAYTPEASAGQHSARFHSAAALTGSPGRLDLHINGNTGIALKRLTFDFINATGNDSLTILLSTNGGASFIRLDSARNSTYWRTKTIFFTSTSATTVIRFEAVDRGSTNDIGLDNVFVSDWADCSGSPAGGSAVTSSAIVCTEPFTLSLTGSAAANGISYQWQSSPDSLTWTNIPGATNFNHTTTQIGTTFYRAVITCSFSSASSNSAGVKVFSPTPVSGTFTIDNQNLTNTATGMFNNFNDAYDYIKCGINGPVVFNVRTGTGPYVEQLIMDPVPGASAVNTVTFRGNGVAEITFNSTSTTERATIKLRGADYIIFDSLVISATGTFGYGVQLMPNSDTNVIKRSVINVNTTATTSNFAGIVINATDAGPIATGNVFADGNKIDSNIINGGLYGITLVATTAGANGNNRIKGNTINNFYQYGIYTAGSYGTLIDSNSISRPSRATVTDFTGIHFTGVHVNARVSKNRIFNPFGGAPASTAAFTGINFTTVDATSGNENWVVNNAIYEVNGNGTQTGISNTSSDNVFYVHNTIALDNTASTATGTTRGFFQTTLAGGIIFYDNMITIRRGGTGAKHAIYLATATSAVNADYNNYFLNAPGTSNGVGFYNGTTRATLADWQLATSMDANSYSRDPFYTNAAAGNLKPTNGALDDKGFYAGIDTDIVGEVRNTSTPDIGAWEFTAPPCTQPPVSGNTWFSDTTVCQLTFVRINSTLSTWGASQGFQWERSTTGAAGTFVPFGGMLTDPDTTIQADTSMYYRLAVTCGATTVHSNSLQMIVSPAMPAGTYTINSNLGTNYVPGVTGGNFQTFNEAKNAMGCGILGPVVFNVDPTSGPYNEQLVLDPILNASAVNTVTFNGNLRTLAYSPGAADGSQRAVIKLNGADHITFDSLVIDATGGTYGYGVQLISDADSNSFTNNTIIASTTATTNFAGVVINSNHAGTITTGITRSDANLFDNNTITGGYYGITVVGSTTVADYIDNNRFTNNTIQDFYNYGMYVAGTSNTLIEGNIFSRPTRTTAATAVYGIGMTGTTSSRLKIDRNRFTNFFGAVPTNTSTAYGIHNNSTDAAVGSEHIISNNLFYTIGGNGPVYALYNIGSNNVWYLHNTISLDNTASTAAGQTVGLYQTTTATGIRFENNIVTISRGGTGVKFGIYTNTTASEVTSNYNDFYITATNGHVGFRTTAHTSLAQWQAASLQDANSVSLNPLYVDPSTGNYRPQLGAIDNMGTPVGILVDILNQPRSATTPDIGAYEFSPTPCVTPPVAGVATVTPNAGVCLESPVDLDITGHSALGSLTFQWQASPDGVSGWVNISPVQFFPEYTTNMTTNSFFRAAVTCNGTTVYTNVTNVVLNPILLSGTYTIDNNNPQTYLPGMTSGNFSSFQNAVNAMLCGIGGPVVFNVIASTYNEQINIPYIRNTNATNTVTFQSDNGVASSVNLTYGANATDNYTLRLDSTRYFTFRNMTFTATNATYGRVIELIDSASNNTFFGNTVNMPAVTVASNNVSGIIMNAFKGVNITVKGNTVNNGSHGIVLTGTAVTNLSKVGHVIDSNFVTGSYVSGIYTQYTKSVPITRNTVSFNTPVQLDAVAIYANYADTAFRIRGNTVNISNTSNSVYGIRVTNSRSLATDSSIINSNKVVIGTGNTGTVYGLSVSTSKAINVVNNTIAMSSAGTNGYGLHHLNNVSDVFYYNNTSNVTSPSATNYAAYFSNAVNGSFQVYNNVFSNKGGGRALYVNNPSYFDGDYNMLYTTGANLVQVVTGATLNFATLKDWTLTWNWDQSSISHIPRFVSEEDLRPDLTHPEVWAMHGRGTQIVGNNYDFNYAPRSETLTGGVPDLGAYEFYPSVEPALLTMSGAPAPNTTQIFTFGSDTVMKITWGPTAPPSVSAKRYSGVVPSGLTPGLDSMFFYTKVDVGGGTNNYNYSMKLYYVDSWRGSIPQEWMIGLGRTTPSNAWVVGQNSKVDVAKNEISQDALIYLDRFTGLVNVWAQPDFVDSSSNRGKDFWIGYQRSNSFSEGNAQEMVLYLGTGDQAANVTVTIEGTTGTPWVRTYVVPPNSALATDFMPKAGADDARLVNAGLYDNKGIHIESDIPIVVYGHIYYNTNSGATMLMPTPTWGYEYYVLTSMQHYTSSSYSAFHFVAQKDSTWIEVNPSNPTQNGMVPNGGTQPNGSYLIKLNKGDVYQVLGNIQSGSFGYDLTGSYVKSISNAQGECHPIAVFSGSTRTSVYCVGNPQDGDNGELIIQQIFPYQAWGTKYLTAPTSLHTGPSATSNMLNYFRVMVKDPTTVVKRNGVILPAASLIGGRYYEFNSNVGDLIESNKPILVAQFEGSSAGACGNSTSIGDAEMFYLSPLEQAVKKSQFYRNTEWDIDYNFITVIIPTEGLTTLRIDGVNYLAYPAAERYVSSHPNMPGYSIVTKKWLAGSGSGTVSSDFPFTGIVYGSGGAESYGYNIGTLVKNLNNLSTVNNTFNTGVNPTEYTCKGAPFQVTALLPLVPDSLEFQFSLVPKLTPATNVMLTNPIPVDTVTINGVEYYAFTISQSFVIDSAGVFQIPIQFWDPEIESCDKRKAGTLFVQVLPKPLTDFAITYSSGNPQGCEGDVATFTGNIITANGIALNQWQWTFHDATTANGQVQSKTFTNPGSYDVKLRGITADGCIADTTKQVVINAKPVVTVTQDNIASCPGQNVTFTISAPIAGATYNWYDAPTGGTLLHTGTSFTISSPTLPASFYVEGISNGCPSVGRKEVTITQAPALTPAVVTVSAATATSVTFSWTAVTGAVSYEVSVNGGPFVPATGTSHTVTGLGTLQSASIVVRAIGANSCQVSLSASVSGCTNSSATVTPVTQEICKGAGATFNVQSPEAGITYSWFTTATGGTALATGTSYTHPNVQSATDLYVEQSNSATGCVSTVRTRVSITLTPDLAVPVVTADSITQTAIRFSWNAIAGATGYQVSFDNGVTWITPTGPGLVHWRTGLLPSQEVTIKVRAIGICGNTEGTVTARSLPDQIFIPNSFSPNGDGLNDRLLAYGYGVQSIQFIVFNQWGEKVFETNNQSTGWDGTFKGRAQPSGVYMYVVKAVLTDGTKIDMKGSINLIR